MNLGESVLASCETCDLSSTQSTRTASYDMALYAKRRPIRSYVVVRKRRHRIVSRSVLIPALFVKNAEPITSNLLFEGFNFRFVRFTVEVQILDFVHERLPPIGYIGR